MKTTTMVVLAALALAGCGDDRIKPNAAVLQQEGTGLATAPAQPGTAGPPVQQQAQAQNSDSGSWFLPAAIGYLIGNMGSARSQPQVVHVPSAPVAAAAPAAPKRSWFSGLTERKPKVPSPGPTQSLVPATKPPALSTTPKTIPVPKPSAPSTPKFGGPSGYKAPTVTFRSSPSVSRSSGRR